MIIFDRGFLKVNESDDYITITLDTNDDTVKSVSNKLLDINDRLNMDGKGWEAFLKFYIEANNDTLLEGLEWSSHDEYCEGSYRKVSSFTKMKGISLAKYIMELFGEKEKGLYCIIRDESNSIDW